MTNCCIAENLISDKQKETCVPDLIKKHRTTKYQHPEQFSFSEHSTHERTQFIFIALKFCMENQKSIKYKNNNNTLPLWLLEKFTFAVHFVTLALVIWLFTFRNLHSI